MLIGRHVRWLIEKLELVDLAPTGPQLLMTFALLPLAACSPLPPAVNAPVSQSHVPQEFDDCNGAGWCPRMVVIPAGSFMMGVPVDEPGYDEIEGPQRPVKIGRFAAGKFDVTRAQWAAFVTATNRDARGGCSWNGRAQDQPDPKGSWHDLGFAQDENHPVVCLSWAEVQEYVEWLSQRTHQRYRLLTEAEWEYAARAGTTTPFPWGATATHEHANYGADECCSPLASGRDQWLYTSPVGAFPPNQFGLYDMHGNVLQFVQDCFASSYAGLPTDGSAYESDVTLKLSGNLSDLSGMNACTFRMVRGGDWGDPPVMIRSGFRNFAPPPGESLAEYRSGGVGFRVARTLPKL
jgi:formylglycine-generating enzyme required for sulfatase activity